MWSCILSNSCHSYASRIWCLSCDYYTSLQNSKSRLKQNNNENQKYKKISQWVKRYRID